MSLRVTRLSRLAAMLAVAMGSVVALAPQAWPQRPPSLVQVDPVREEILARTVPVIGRLVPRQAGVVAARIGGPVDEMRVATTPAWRRSRERKSGPANAARMARSRWGDSGCRGPGSCSKHDSWVYKVVGMMSRRRGAPEGSILAKGETGAQLPLFGSLSRIDVD